MKTPIVKFEIFTRELALAEFALPESSTNLELWDAICAQGVEQEDGCLTLAILDCEDSEQFLLEQKEYALGLDSPVDLSWVTMESLRAGR